MDVDPPDTPSSTTGNADDVPSGTVEVGGVDRSMTRAPSSSAAEEEIVSAVTGVSIADPVPCSSRTLSNPRLDAAVSRVNPTPESTRFEVAGACCAPQVEPDMSPIDLSLSGAKNAACSSPWDTNATVAYEEFEVQDLSMKKKMPPAEDKTPLPTVSNVTGSTAPSEKKQQVSELGHSSKISGNVGKVDLEIRRDAPALASETSDSGNVPESSSSQKVGDPQRSMVSILSTNTAKEPAGKAKSREPKPAGSAIVKAPTVQTTVVGKANDVVHKSSDAEKDTPYYSNLRKFILHFLDI